MANYLPVLLVSVAANTVPDDSSLSTVPRSQVDYLSHNWQEEDVWRSWRNMTRQKNEIANGMRLENASWRTWWKQRNGLGTVTPETLNWLKDSDVTWLYGPLHTAVDWAPPKPIPSDGHSALDLSSPIHKPILKHRSISELLTSELPNSPIFSPIESEDDGDYPPHTVPLQPPEEPGGDGSAKLRRPPLTHTKSDTFITRSNPYRPFGQDLPPQILPSTQVSSRQTGHSLVNLEGYSSNTNQSSDGNSTSTGHGYGHDASNNNNHKKRHISFNTFVEQCIAIEKPKKGSDYDEGDEDSYDASDNVHDGVSSRYPSNRTSWDDDGYEEDEEDSEDDAEAVSPSMWGGRFSGGNNGSALSCSDSDSNDNDDGVGEEDGANEEEEGDGMIETHTSFGVRTKSTSPRSQSTSSSSSTSTSISTSSSRSTDVDERNGRPTSKRRLSTSTTSTYRPRIQRAHSSASSSVLQGDRHHVPPLVDNNGSSERSENSVTSPPSQAARVTIAPIAPTMLKTGPHDDIYALQAGWAEGFGDEGGSDDGLWGESAPKWWGTGAATMRSGKGKESDEDDGQTPVELVYVPSFGSIYGSRTAREWDQRMSVREKRGQERRSKSKREVNGSKTGPGGEAASEVMEDHEDGFGNSDRDVYHRTTVFSVGDEDADTDADDAESTLVPGGVHMGAPVPTVIVKHDARADVLPRRSSSLSLNRGAPVVESTRGRSTSSSGSSAVRSGLEDRERSKSRSRSRSRTPSPAILSPSTSLSPPAASSPPVTNSVPVPSRRGSRSISTSPSSVTGGLLSPPSRGRSSYQDSGHIREQQQQQQQSTRGRSSTRTASNSLSDRELSTGQHNSPIGSLSPDGVGLGDMAGAYSGSRIDRERERERERRTEMGRERGREKIRGRDRTEIQRLRHSRSADDVQDSLLQVSLASTTRAQAPAEFATIAHAPKYDASQGSSASSTSSSSSSRSTGSTQTIVPSRNATSTPIDVRTAEEHARSLQPTPMNSPSIEPHTSLSIDATLQPKTPTPPSPTHATKTKPPLVVPPPHPAEPSTSFSISPPREADAHSSPSPPKLRRGSFAAPGNSDPNIVGKAVGMVSSAGAFLGLWPHHS